VICLEVSCIESYLSDDSDDRFRDCHTFDGTVKTHRLTTSHRPWRYQMLCPASIERHESVKSLEALVHAVFSWPEWFVPPDGPFPRVRLSDCVRLVTHAKNIPEMPGYGHSNKPVLLAKGRIVGPCRVGSAGQCLSGRGTRNSRSTGFYIFDMGLN